MFGWMKFKTDIPPPPPPPNKKKQKNNNNKNQQIKQICSNHQLNKNNKFKGT